MLCCSAHSLIGPDHVAGMPWAATPLIRSGFTRLMQFPLIRHSVGLGNVLDDEVVRL